MFNPPVRADVVDAVKWFRLWRGYVGGVSLMVRAIAADITRATC